MSKYEIELEYEIKDCRDCPFKTERRFLDHFQINEFQMSGATSMERYEYHCGINNKRLEFAMRPENNDCPLVFIQVK